MVMSKVWTPKSPEELRKLFESKVLKKPANPWFWFTFQKFRGKHLDDILKNSGDRTLLTRDLEDLRDDYEEIEEKIKESKGESRDYQTNDKRWEVFSLLLAQEAAKDPEVKSFWEDLGKPVEDVEGWINEHRAEEIAEDKGYETLDCPDYEGNADRIIRIPIPQEEEEEEVSPLFELKQLAQKLERDYGWREYQAVHFLLTKRPPRRVFAGRAWPLPDLGRVFLEVSPVLLPREVSQLYQLIRRDYQQPSEVPQAEEYASKGYYIFHQRYPWLDRVCLEVSPLLSTGAVSQLYQEILRNHGVKRSRSFKPKTYELILFVATEGEGKTWNERRMIWNDRHRGKDRFGSAEVMRKSYHRAVKTLRKQIFKR